MRKKYLSIIAVYFHHNRHTDEAHDDARNRKSNSQKIQEKRRRD